MQMKIDSLIQGVSLAIGKPIPREKYEILDRGFASYTTYTVAFRKNGSIYVFV